jgi:hypothetical protein
MRTLGGLIASAWTVLLVAHPGVPRADCLKNRDGAVICGKGRCERDTRGAVFCAPHRDGNVVRMSDGTIVCAKGQCEKTAAGDVLCSATEGGGAYKDVDGTIQCVGGCVPASQQACETERARK